MESAKVRHSPRGFVSTTVTACDGGRRLALGIVEHGSGDVTGVGKVALAPQPVSEVAFFLGQWSNEVEQGFGQDEVFAGHGQIHGVWGQARIVPGVHAPSLDPQTPFHFEDGVSACAWAGRGAENTGRRCHFSDKVSDLSVRVLSTSMVCFVNDHQGELAQVDGTGRGVVPHHLCGGQDDFPLRPQVWPFGGSRLPGEHHHVLLIDNEVGQQHALVLGQQSNGWGQEEDTSPCVEVVRDGHPLDRRLAKPRRHDDHGRTREGRCSGLQLVATCFHATSQPRMNDRGHALPPVSKGDKGRRTEGDPPSTAKTIEDWRSQDVHGGLRFPYRTAHIGKGGRRNAPRWAARHIGPSLEDSGGRVSHSSRPEHVSRPP